MTKFEEKKHRPGPYAASGESRGSAATPNHHGDKGYQIQAPEVQAPETMDISVASEANSSSSGAIGEVGGSHITQEHNPTEVLEFHKTFQIYSAGFQFKKQSSTFLSTVIDWTTWFTDAGSNVLTTPLSVIDPNALPWFLSEVEYANLPVGATAKHCHIRVTPLGYRLPFATNEATSTYANSQTLVQIAKAIGLNNSMNGLVGGYEADPADLSTVTSQKISNMATLTSMLYGDVANSAIGANMGIPRHNNYYFSVLTNKANNTPNLMPYLEISNVNDNKGLPFIDYRYEYKEAMLKLPSNSQFGPVQNGGGIWEGKNPQTWGKRVGGTTSRADNDNRLLELYGNTSISAAPQFAYNSVIEKAPYMSRYYNKTNSPRYPPLISFGVMPVQSNAALSSTVSFADVVIQWQVETTLLIEYQLNFFSPTTDIFYLDFYDPSFGLPNSAMTRAADNMLLIQNRKTVTDNSAGTIVIPNKGPFRPAS